MIEFGKTLREAREAKGITVAQLAEMTHMTASRVEELESENFTGIPAAIYGRGFVRLYCHAVGLDPKPLSDEFTEIFNGNRDLEIRERAPEPDPIPAAPEEVTRNPTAGETAPEEPAAEPAVEQGPALSRYAAPLRNRPKISVPPAVWRFALLGCAALLVLWALVVGIRALYRATDGAPAGDEPSAEAASAEPANAEPSGTRPEATRPSASAEPRTPQAIPALYVD